MMTPISRIPMDIESPPLHAIVHGELNQRAYPTENGDSLAQLIDHTGNQNDISVTLDWAMQIRNEMGISWGESIDAAMTLYFG